MKPKPIITTAGHNKNYVEWYWEPPRTRSIIVMQPVGKAPRRGQEDRRNLIESLHQWKAPGMAFGIVYRPWWFGFGRRCIALLVCVLDEPLTSHTQIPRGILNGANVAKDGSACLGHNDARRILYKCQVDPIEQFWNTTFIYGVPMVQREGMEHSVRTLGLIGAQGYFSNRFGGRNVHHGY